MILLRSGTPIYKDSVLQKEFVVDASSPVADSCSDESDCEETDSSLPAGLFQLYKDYGCVVDIQPKHVKQVKKFTNFDEACLFTSIGNVVGTFLSLFAKVDERKYVCISMPKQLAKEQIMFVGALDNSVTSNFASPTLPYFWVQDEKVKKWIGGPAFSKSCVLRIKYLLQQSSVSYVPVNAANNKDDINSPKSWPHAFTAMDIADLAEDICCSSKSPARFPKRLFEALRPIQPIVNPGLPVDQIKPTLFVENSFKVIFPNWSIALEYASKHYDPENQQRARLLKGKRRRLEASKNPCLLATLGMRTRSYEFAIKTTSEFLNSQECILEEKNLRLDTNNNSIEQYSEFLFTHFGRMFQTAGSTLVLTTSNDVYVVFVCKEQLKRCQGIPGNVTGTFRLFEKATYEPKVRLHAFLKGAQRYKRKCDNFKRNIFNPNKTLLYFTLDRYKEKGVFPAFQKRCVFTFILCFTRFMNEHPKHKTNYLEKAGDFQKIVLKMLTYYPFCSVSSKKRKRKRKRVSDNNEINDR